MNPKSACLKRREEEKSEESASAKFSPSSTVAGILAGVTAAAAANAGLHGLPPPSIAASSVPASVSTGPIGSVMASSASHSMDVHQFKD